MADKPDYREMARSLAGSPQRLILWAQIARRVLPYRQQLTSTMGTRVSVLIHRGGSNGFLEQEGNRIRRDGGGN